MGRDEYIRQMNSEIMNCKKNAVLQLDEATYGSGLLHEVLPSLAHRLDVSVELEFEYDNERYKTLVPSGTIMNKYIKGDNTTNIDRLVDDFNAELV